jgi:predicted oxidoreductase
MAHSPLLSPQLSGPERLAFGTWRLLQNPRGAEPSEVAKLLRLCVELGIRLVDTAEIYGHYQVEELLGRALALDPELKNELRFITKCGIYVPCPRQTGVNVPHYNATEKQVVASAETSLRLLGLEQLDLLLIHRPDWLTPACETARALDGLVTSGKVREIGVSNYSPSQWGALAGFLQHPLATNQVEFSLLHHQPMFDGTFDRCQSTDTIPMAWSVLGGGKLFSDDDTARDTVAALQTIGRKLDAEPDEIAYAWALHHPSRPVAITGTMNPDRLRRAARAADLSLSREDWFFLWAASAGRKLP